MKNNYGFSLDKAEIFDRRNYNRFSTDIFYKITKQLNLFEKILQIQTEEIFREEETNIKS